MSDNVKDNFREHGIQWENVQPVLYFEQLSGGLLLLANSCQANKDIAVSTIEGQTPF